MLKPTVEERLDDIEHRMRVSAGEASGQALFIELLLARIMASMPIEVEAKFMDNLMTLGRRTEHLVATDDASAELQADVAVWMSETIDRIVKHAKMRADEVRR